MSDWINEYGQEFCDYELRAIESDHYNDRLEAASYLAFTEEHFGMRDVQAMSCQACGALFTESIRHLRAHRRKCGWDNGKPAIAIDPMVFGIVTDLGDVNVSVSGLSGQVPTKEPR